MNGIPCSGRTRFGVFVDENREMLDGNWEGCRRDRKTRVTIQRNASRPLHCTSLDVCISVQVAARSGGRWRRAGGDKVIASKSGFGQEARATKPYPAREMAEAKTASARDPFDRTPTAVHKKIYPVP